MLREGHAHANDIPIAPVQHDRTAKGEIPGALAASRTFDGGIAAPNGAGHGSHPRCRQAALCYNDGLCSVSTILSSYGQAILTARPRRAKHFHQGRGRRCASVRPAAQLCLRLLGPRTPCSSGDGAELSHDEGWRIPHGKDPRFSTRTTGALYVLTRSSPLAARGPHLSYTNARHLVQRTRRSMTFPPTRRSTPTHALSGLGTCFSRPDVTAPVTQTSTRSSSSPGPHRWQRGRARCRAATTAAPLQTTMTPSTPSTSVDGPRPGVVSCPRSPPLTNSAGHAVQRCLSGTSIGAASVHCAAPIGDNSMETVPLIRLPLRQHARRRRETIPAKLRRPRP